MSQFADQTQEQIAEFQESHVRMQKLTASVDKVVKILQEGHAQLRKASEEARRRLNQAVEEQHRCRKDRDSLDQYLKKKFMSTKT
ncbi:hypothetical protein O181_094918 [Austropuccinia psidii MF-1]|uniref:Uncharacterized protein n=1 Tax=Austropuccinia psidii MF-1 TaxID=1389203 RepID=A0A9Q3J2X1_9BASI|nr:hypothetical protein [Austropuccinia psidii MF-1]